MHSGFCDVCGKLRQLKGNLDKSRTFHYTMCESRIERRILMKKYEIRPIRKSDDPAMASIIRRNLEHYHLDLPGTVYVDPELDHLSYFYAKEPDKRAYFVLTDGAGRVLGGAGFAEFPGFADCAELQKLYLVDEAKGNGLGRGLLETVELYAESMGYQRLYLETHINLKEAMGLYEKMGFSPIPKPQNVQHSTMNRFYLKELGQDLQRGATL